MFRNEGGCLVDIVLKKFLFKVIFIWLNKYLRIFEMSFWLVLIFFKCNEIYKNIWGILLRRIVSEKLFFLKS